MRIIIGTRRAHLSQSSCHADLSQERRQLFAPPQRAACRRLSPLFVSVETPPHHHPFYHDVHDRESTLPHAESISCLEFFLGDRPGVDECIVCISCIFPLGLLLLFRDGPRVDKSVISILGLGTLQIFCLPSAINPELPRLNGILTAARRKCVAEGAKGAEAP